MDHFYVYEHWRPDKNQCFYVGKGQRKRSHHLTYRNPHHKAIQAKLERSGHSVEIRIIERGLTEMAAFNLECERIAYWRSAGVILTNRTDGGNGVSGLVMSPEAKLKMARAKDGMIVPAHVRAMAEAKNRGAKRSQETVEKIKAAITGIKRTPEQVEAMRERSRLLMANPARRAYLSSINLGKKQTAESIEKTRAANKGRPLSAEHRAKIGAANKGKKTALGMRRSEETRRKQSQAALLREERKRQQRELSLGLC